jgi:hypothetical protein
MRLLPLLALLPALVACTHGPSPGPDGPVAQQPEAASGFTAKPGWRFQRQAVAAAHPLAADAGHAVLRAGGNAMDAAVAVQMVLALVEPQSSGIGGGAFLLHWDGAQVQAWDGRETAPAAADERLFLQPDGRPMAVPQAQVGGRAVGVPGVVRMLEAAHRRHGRLPWAQLLQPAIDLAERGFAITPRLHTLLAADAALRRDPLAAALYYGADGQARPGGPCAAATRRWRPCCVRSPARVAMRCTRGRWRPTSWRVCVAMPATRAGCRWPTWPPTGRCRAMRCAPTGHPAGASAACRRRRRGTWRWCRC